MKFGLLSFILFTQLTAIALPSFASSDFANQKYMSGFYPLLLLDAVY